ncbi:uncharacterized protein MELLADRAFT_86423 [Melampsora larici-populina 98AG31]|uniref:Uncharacterized protein n=1 Tax=Melampsora larici-populina (strain 98AG31 / pathotype 3-4-7) TaxID=747676 RepID=F4RLS2_MELLP|nr:uncharacterized protein MELLADRAFT_86423 [Melampsora larici-populina 98AG31]EGG06703.1 hypothetical protein MELLADRAFT_86423 [Melampsora larici-populina 98AG31]
MGRSRNRARKKNLGYPTENFKSKTSDCFLNARLRRDQENNIGKPYPRRHTARTERKASLAAKLGVPKDTTFIFRDRAQERAEGPYLENLKLNFGTTVIIDRKDSSLVLAVRCNEFKKMSTEERESFRFGISTPFLHARARNVNELHHSIQLLILALIYWGWMGCCGWRAGTDPGKKFAKAVARRSLFAEGLFS